MSARVHWALVLAAGYGTRLGPLVARRAKAALPIAGIPLIRRLLAWLARAGIREVVINLHYRPETLTALVGDGTDLGLRVRYSWERDILGTAGGVRRALPLIDAPRFFVVNGDTLTDPPLETLLDGHLASGALVTLAVVSHPDPARYGGVLADEMGRVVGFRPRGAGPSGWHFIGVQLVEAAAFSDLPDGRRIDAIPDLYEPLARRQPGAVRILPVQARFFEIGTPRDYLRTVLAVAREEGLEAPPRGMRSRVDPSARLVRTVVWDDVIVGPGCDLADCIVTDGVTVPPGARISGQILLTQDQGRPPASARVVAPGLLAVPLDPVEP